MAPTIRGSSHAATVPAVVPTLRVAELPSPRFVRAVAGLLRSERLAAFWRLAAIAAAWAAAADPAGSAPTSETVRVSHSSPVEVALLARSAWPLVPTGKRAAV